MRDRRGVALPAVLLALTVLAAIASGLAAAVAAGLRTASYASDGARAQALAEAGVEAALAQVCPDGRLPDGTTQLNGSLGGGTFQVQLDPVNRRLEAEGRYGRARQRLEAAYTWRPPAATARAVFVGGDWRVDEKTRVEGSAYTGGRLTLARDLTVTQAPGAFGEGSDGKVEAGSVVYGGGQLQASAVFVPRDRTLSPPPRYRDWFRECADSTVTGLTALDRGLQVLALVASSGNAGRLIYVDGDLTFLDDPLLDRLVPYSGTATVYVKGRVCAPLGLSAGAGSRLWVIAEEEAWALNTGIRLDAFVESRKDVHLVGALTLLNQLFCWPNLPLVQILALLSSLVPIPASVNGGIAAGGTLDVDAFPGIILDWFKVTANPAYQLNPPPGAGVPHISEWRIQP